MTNSSQSAANLSVANPRRTQLAAGHLYQPTVRATSDHAPDDDSARAGDGSNR